MWSKLRSCFSKSADSGDEASALTDGRPAAVRRPAAAAASKYRFCIGDRVEAGFGKDEWYQGTVVEAGARQPWWPRGKTAAYRIRLDAGCALGPVLVFAPKDQDKMVRRAKQIDEMSVKELRELAAGSGVSTDGCLEKSELRAKAHEVAAGVVAEAVREIAESSQQTAEMKLAGLDCLVFGGDLLRDGPPEQVVVLMHGLGATNDQFLPFCAQLMQCEALSRRRVVWVLPNAPKQTWGVIGAVQGHFTPGGQWWNVDMVKLALEMRKGEKGMAKLLRDEPRGMKQCRERIRVLLSEIRSTFGVENKAVVLSGFSQGAITAMDSALALDRSEACAGVVMMSGTPMVVEQWHERLKEHPGVKVMITHGTQDRTLPYAAAGWCRDLLVRGGAEVHFKTHCHGHTVGTPDIIIAIAGFIASCG